MDVWSYLQGVKRPIVLYGTGNGADKLINHLNALGISLSGVFASNGFVRNRYFRGMPVETFEDVYNKYPDMIVLMCFGSSRGEVIQNVKALMSRCELLFPEVPVYGDDIFDEAFFLSNAEKLEAVKRYLADEKSVKTWEGLIRYKLSGKIGELFAVEEEKAVTDRLLRLPDNPAIMDLGAYNGDTVQKFAALYDDYKKIIAVEPDKHSFEKLKLNTQTCRDTEYVNALIGDNEGIGYMEKARGRGAHEQKNNGIETKIITVDSLCEHQKVDFIKMDVEGNELAALKGAAKTLKRDKPFLEIACYHKSEDLFTLPLYLLSLNADYRFYIRHAPGVPAWDTDFLVFDKNSR